MSSTMIYFPSPCFAAFTVSFSLQQQVGSSAVPQWSQGDFLSLLESIQPPFAPRAIPPSHQKKSRQLETCHV